MALAVGVAESMVCPCSETLVSDSGWDIRKSPATGVADGVSEERGSATQSRSILQRPSRAQWEEGLGGLLRYDRVVQPIVMKSFVTLDTCV